MRLAQTASGARSGVPDSDAGSNTLDRDGCQLARLCRPTLAERALVRCQAGSGPMQARKRAQQRGGTPLRAAHLWRAADRASWQRRPQRIPRGEPGVELAGHCGQGARARAGASGQAQVRGSQDGLGVPGGLWRRLLCRALQCGAVSAQGPPRRPPSARAGGMGRHVRPTQVAAAGRLPACPPVEEMCMTWLYRSTSISFSTLTLPAWETCGQVRQAGRAASTVGDCARPCPQRGALAAAQGPAPAHKPTATPSGWGAALCAAARGLATRTSPRRADSPCPRRYDPGPPA